MKPLPLLVLIIVLFSTAGCKTVSLKGYFNSEGPVQGTQTLTDEEVAEILKPPVVPLRTKIINTAYSFINKNLTAMIALAFLLTLWLAYSSAAYDPDDPPGLDDEQKAMLRMAADTLKDLTESIDNKGKANIIPFSRGS